MYIITIGLLVFIATVCGIGVFHSGFKDNLLQRCGMSLIALGSLSVAYRIWDAQWTPNSDATFIIGTVCFFIGTWIKKSLPILREHHD